MNQIIPIKESIFWIGTNDHETHLFESIWPLPRGVSYNSYIIVDEKTALIDTVKNSTSMTYLDKLEKVLNGKSLDYLIINHMEPDHSGTIKILTELYPNLKIIGNTKTADFLKNFYAIVDNFQVVEDQSVLDLGKHKLQFHFTPMVHWPETMMTYETTNKILFAGDAFGGFGSLNAGIFDDEVDLEFFEDEILRYFSNIVGKYSSMVQKAIAKLSGLDIKIIAATHGPVWRTNPGNIIDMYDRWSRHEAEEGVVVVFASMYGNTERMMESVAQGLTGENVRRIRIHNAATTHPSYMIRDIWRFKAVVLGSPTYNLKLFPPVEYLLQMLENEMLKNRILGIFGTFGW
ncbi:MAG: FprA family A-type flavoprotein, partial [Candidatus Auribacter fodinae]